MEVVSFAPLPFHLRGNCHQQQMYRRLGGAQSAFGHYGEEKNPLPLSGIELRFFGHLARSRMVIRNTQTHSVERIQSFNMLKQVLHIATTGLQNVDIRISPCSALIFSSWRRFPPLLYTSKFDNNLHSLTYVEFEVLRAVVIKSTIFWDITPCSPLKVNRCFGGTYRLLLQSRRISRARNQRESRWQAMLDIQRTTGHYIPEYSTLHSLT
jgi:hypothetical protein